MSGYKCKLNIYQLWHLAQEFLLDCFINVPLLRNDIRANDMYLQQWEELIRES